MLRFVLKSKTREMELAQEAEDDVNDEELPYPAKI